MIKLSVGRDAPFDYKAGASEIAEATGSHVAQVIGRMVLLYRRRHDRPVINLPGTFIEGAKPGPVTDEESS